MSFEFQSTLVNVTSSYRIGGNQIGGVRIENNGGIRVARVIVTNDADVKFALSGPYQSGDPDAIYATLSADLYELAPGVLVNEGAIGSVVIEADKIVIDLEGSDRKFTFMPDAVVTEATEIADHTWKLTTAGFAALGTAAAAWRSSLDTTLGGLNSAIVAVQADVDQNEADADAAIATETADRIAADSAIQADVDANEADGDAADAALSGRLDVLEADPTTATDVAAGDTATLSSANSYTDTAISNVIGSAPAVLDTLGEIADAINDDANAYTTLVTQIAAVQTDVDGNETDGDAADAALSGRLDTLEADPTTATAVAAVQADVDQNESDGDAADAALSARLDVLEADPTTAAAVAAVQADVDQNEVDADAAIAGEATARANADTALSGRVDVLEADPTTATAVAAVQADVDQNEADADSADAALSGRLDVLEADPTTATAVAAVQADVDQNESDADAAIAAETAARIAGDAAANAYTDSEIAALIGSAPGVLNTLEEIANAINDDADVYTTLVSQIVAGDTAEATTRAAADVAMQADIDQNESDSDAADAALSGRLDVLEADPTTATAVAAVQADVDQNEADADAAIALKLDASAVSTFGGTLVDDADAATARTTLGLGSAATTASTDYATAAQGTTADAALPAAGAQAALSVDHLITLSGVAEAADDLGTFSGSTISGSSTVKAALQELSNAIEATQSDVDTNEADADTADALRVLLSGTNIPGPYANDTAAASGGVAVGALYKHDNGQIHYRVS